MDERFDSRAIARIIFRKTQQLYANAKHGPQPYVGADNRLHQESTSGITTYDLFNIHILRRHGRDNRSNYTFKGPRAIGDKIRRESFYGARASVERREL